MHDYYKSLPGYISAAANISLIVGIIMLFVRLNIGIGLILLCPILWFIAARLHKTEVARYYKSPEGINDLRDKGFSEDAIKYNQELAEEYARVGWFKRRLFLKMEGLTNVAQMATSMALARHFCLDEGNSEAETDMHYMKAAAWANYLFGKPPNTMHIQQIDLAKEHAAAREWLKANHAFRELVVQSLRVTNILNYGKRVNWSSIVGEEILETFGSEYPEAPDPTNYRALVQRTIRLLPPNEQQSLLWRPKTAK